MSKNNNDVVLNAAGKVISPGFFKWLGGWFRDHYILLGGLALSSTQTFVMVDFFAPEWAFWLPFVAIAVMEGGVIMWEYLEEVADMADGDVEDTEKNAQERIASFMVWVSLGMSGPTMIAGVFVEVTQSQLAEILSPNPALLNFFGWISLTGIFLLVTLNLFMEWRYKRADPIRILERENRQKERAANRIARTAELEGQVNIARKEAEFLKKRYKRSATRIGYGRAKDRFEKGTKNED